MNHVVFLVLAGLGVTTGGLAAAAPGLAVSASNHKAPRSMPVTIEAFQFSPSPLEVPVGTRVVFMNKDPTAHTVTPDDGQSFQRTGRIDAGASKTVAFEKPGTFDYYCEIHPTMHGKVVVK